MAVTCRNAWDSKSNVALTRLLIEAGGKGNEEFSHLAHQLPTKARDKVTQVTHLNNKEKDKALSAKGVRWEDILGEAKELHCTVTVKGSA